MNIIKGLDNGYSYTKDNEYRIFKSAYSRVNKTLSDDNKIIINGESIYFGTGTMNGDVDKVNSTVNEVCTLANIAQTGSHDYYLVLGLPFNQCLGNEEKFKEKIMEYNNREVIYKDKKVNFTIRDVTVFAQGLGAVFGLGLQDGEYITFDIGSYTMNVALVEIINDIPKIIQYNTWYDGILTIYDDIISEVNKRYELTLSNDYAEKIISRGLVVDGVEQDTRFVTLMMKDYLENVFSRFKTNYPTYSITPILASGGGSILLWNVLEKAFCNAILLPNSQFANAQGYYDFGLRKYM